jgi:hypothetical protein
MVCKEQNKGSNKKLKIDALDNMMDLTNTMLDGRSQLKRLYTVCSLYEIL